MRRQFLSLVALAALTGMAAPSVAADGLSVPIDQSAAVTLPIGAQNVMVGNPAVADVNVLDQHTAVILGRGYGVTNLLVIDARGRTIMDRQIVVGAVDGGRISVYRRDANGPRVDNFTCSPRCERTPMPGESEIEYNRYATGYTGYNGRATEARNSGGAAKPGP